MGPRMAEPCAPDNMGLSEGEWYGLQVTPRHEKRVSIALAQRKIDVFLPTVTERHRWSDRVQTIEAPLFPGYTFVRFPQKSTERITVLRCVGVVRIVGKEWVGTPIPAKEIEDIKTLLNSRVGLWPHPFFQIGDRVRIRSGALEGVEGVLAQRRGDRQLVVSIDLIQKSVVISIEGYEVERIRKGVAA